MSDTINTQRPIGWEADQINAAIAATKIRFNVSNADALTAFNREVVFSEAGEPQAIYDGQALPLADALTRWAVDDRTGIADRRTLPRDPVAGRPGSLAKSSMSTSEKVAFINEHGSTAFEALPLTNKATSEVTSKADFYKLPLSEKTRLTRENPNFFASLPNTPTGQIRGSYVNHAAIAKAKAARGR
jgi:hypothetical protein